MVVVVVVVAAAALIVTTLIIIVIAVVTIQHDFHSLATTGVLCSHCKINILFLLYSWRVFATVDQDRVAFAVAASLNCLSLSLFVLAV